MEMTVQVGFDELLRAIDQLSPEQRKTVETRLQTNTHHTTISQERQFGSLKGLITYIADDFDDPLNDFSEYM